MEIVMKKVSELKPYEKNPRKNDEAVKYVAKSIEQFGFKAPIVIDNACVIVAGHTRWKAAKQLGIETVPCIVADDLTDEQIKAYRLADNKVAEKTEWDFSLLAMELEELFDFNMSDFGFLQGDNINLDVNDDDFLQDTEVTKDKKAKEVICPDCGKVIVL